MRTLLLYRRYFDHGTYGVLCDDCGNELTKTAERPWINNKPGISCVPEGEYILEPHTSPRFGSCYALAAPELGVTIYGPSLRTHILVHSANLPEELEGCIALGMNFGVLKNKWAVLDSRVAVEQFMKHLDGERARLIIRNA